MKHYIIKRLLIMFPTFFGITIVVFTIVNLAPMSVSAKSQAQGETAEGAGETGEAIRYFKQEFHLDKPVLFNTRWTLTQDDIKEKLEMIFLPQLVGFSDSNVLENTEKSNSNLQELKSKKQAGLPNVDDEKRKTIKGTERISARDDLIDYGRDSVLHLYSMLKEAQDDAKKVYEKLSKPMKEFIAQRPSMLRDFTSWEKLTENVSTAKNFTNQEIADFNSYKIKHLWRFYVANFLSLNAKKTQLVFDSSSRSSNTDFLRKQNQKIFKDNLYINNYLTLKSTSTEEEFENTLALWKPWIDKEKSDLEYTFLEKINAFFLETRFAKFWGRIIKLDFGISLKSRKPVLPELIRRMQYSLSIALTSTMIAWFLAIPIGIYSAVKQNTVQDRILTTILFILYSLPTFFAGTILLYYLATTQGWQEFSGVFTLRFAGNVLLISAIILLIAFISALKILYSLIQKLRQGSNILASVIWLIVPCLLTLLAVHWNATVTSFSASPPLPLGGFHSPFEIWMTMNSIDRTKDLIWHLMLPIICMTYGSLSVLSRYTRSGILDVIRSDYVRTARAKGLPERVVILKHVVRNGIIPIITLLGHILPVIIGGSVIIEVIFGIDGMGNWMFESITNNDYNVVMTVSMFTAVLTLVGILISDLLYAVVDPRISFD